MNLTIDDCVAMAIESYKTQRALGFGAVSYCAVYAMTQYGFSEEDCLEAYNELLEDCKDFDDDDFFDYIKYFLEFEVYLKEVDQAGLGLDVKFVR